MERREFERIDTELEIHCCDIMYFGTITNLSENGIFIRSDNLDFPIDSQFEVYIPYKGRTLHIPVRPIRLSRNGYRFDGLGVKLLKPLQEYSDFVKRLRRGSD